MLKILNLSDQLIIKQKVEVLEAITGALGIGFETKNKYKIKNSLGQVLLIISVYWYRYS